MVNDLISKGALIAQVFDINSMNGINFPTPESATFQFGFGHISENKVLIPHIHKRVKRKIETTSEFLYVVHGQMIIDVLNEEEELVEKVVLKDNMALLQFIGGHKIEIKSGTKYFEIKQGPYYGRDFDKFNVKI
jgi:hypothetical protein